MLSRMKFDIEPLVDEILDQLPAEVWTRKTTTFFDPAIGGGQFVRAIETRLRNAGHSEANIRSRVYGLEESDLHIRYAVNKHKLVGQYSKMSYEQFFKWNNTMKFDVVVGNPPYQDKNGMENTTTSKDLAQVFVKKSFELALQELALIIPSDWTSPNKSALKNFLFKDVKLKKLALYGNKWFNVKKNTCTIFYSKGHTGLCSITDINGKTSDLDLSLFDTISLDNSQTEFVSKFKQFKNLSERWLHGSLNLTTMQTLKGAGVEFICAVGRKGQPLVTEMISTGHEMTGLSKHKLVMPMVGEGGKFGNIKKAKPSHVGGHSVVFLVTNSDQESDNLLAYLNTKLVRLIVKSVKKSTPNSKGIFESIPDVPLNKVWTDAKLYKHFNLTQEEIDYIEANVK